jgi:hypothetical protein
MTEEDSLRQYAYRSTEYTQEDYDKEFLLDSLSGNQYWLMDNVMRSGHRIYCLYILRDTRGGGYKQVCYPSEGCGRHTTCPSKNPYRSDTFGADEICPTCLKLIKEHPGRYNYKYFYSQDVKKGYVLRTVAPP